MISIIFGHWCSYVDIYLYDLGGLGVHIFLLISGYLCGQKSVNSPLKWYKKRVIRILMPVWIWTAMLVIAGLFVGHFDFKFIGSLFGLEGISWVLPISIPYMEGMQHTWYVTVILLCYFLVPLFQKINWENKYIVFSVFGLLLVLQVALIFINVQFVFFIQFLAGYYLAENKNRKYKLILPVFGALMLIVCAVRVFNHRLNIPEIIYGHIIAEWSENFIALFMFFCIEALCDKYSAVSEKISNNRVVGFLDDISYPAYLTHYSLLHGVVNVGIVKSTKTVQTLIFVLLIAMSSCAVMWLDKFFRKTFEKKKNKAGFAG